MLVILTKQILHAEALALYFDSHHTTLFIIILHNNVLISRDSRWRQPCAVLLQLTHQGFHRQVVSSYLY